MLKKSQWVAMVMKKLSKIQDIKLMVMNLCECTLLCHSNLPAKMNKINLLCSFRDRGSIQIDFIEKIVSKIAKTHVANLLVVENNV